MSKQVREPSIRINFFLPKKSKERLDRMLKIVEANTYAEVFKNALRIYEYLTNELQNGSEIFIVTQNGEKTKVPYI